MFRMQTLITAMSVPLFFSRPTDMLLCYVLFFVFFAAIFLSNLPILVNLFKSGFSVLDFLLLFFWDFLSFDFSFKLAKHLPFSCETK